MRGQIKNWNEGRGFGFIGGDEGGEDLFVHAKDLPHGVLSLAAGQMVEWEPTHSPDGRLRAKVLSVDALASRSDSPAEPADDTPPASDWKEWGI